MTDSELMIMKDKIEEMIRAETYREEGFPLSCGGLRGIQNTIMFSFWVRKGKGIKITCGEVVVCELKESPWWQRYQKENVFIDEGKEYEAESSEHERDIRVEEKGEFV